MSPDSDIPMKIKVKHYSLIKLVETCMCTQRHKTPLIKGTPQKHRKNRKSTQPTNEINTFYARKIKKFSNFVKLQKKSFPTMGIPLLADLYIKNPPHMKITSKNCHLSQVWNVTCLFVGLFVYFGWCKSTHQSNLLQYNETFYVFHFDTYSTT